MTSALICAITFTLLSMATGMVFYGAQKEIERPVSYVASHVLCSIMGLVVSFLLMEGDNMDPLSGSVLRLLLFIGFWIFYYYIIKVGSRLAEFYYHGERDDYSLKAYFRWRRYFIKRDKVLDNKMDKEHKAFMVGALIIPIILSFYVIGIFVIYHKAPSIPPDQYSTIDYPVEGATITVYPNTDIFSGLPLSQEKKVWKTSDATSITFKADVYLTTDRKDISKTYWVIETDDLIKSDQVTFPNEVLKKNDVLVICNGDAVVRRSDGQIID